MVTKEVQRVTRKNLRPWLVTYSNISSFKGVKEYLVKRRDSIYATLTG